MDYILYAKFFGSWVSQSTGSAWFAATSSFLLVFNFSAWKQLHMVIQARKNSFQRSHFTYIARLRPGLPNDITFMSNIWKPTVAWEIFEYRMVLSLDFTLNLGISYN